MNAEDDSQNITKKAQKIIVEAVQQYALNLEARMIECHRQNTAYQKLRKLEQEIYQAGKSQPKHVLEDV